jgi:hypothetical protein
MKTAHVVLNLTMAGFLSVEVATGEEPLPVAEPSPRFRFGVEQTFASFRHTSQTDYSSDTLAWGLPGGTDLTADYRVAGPLELGVAAWISAAHSENSYIGGNSSMTGTEIRLNPRVSYGLPIAGDLALSPRLGIEYIHGISHGEATGGFDDTFVTRTLSATPGLMLEYSPTPSLFVSTGPETQYQMYTSYDGRESGWFGDQAVRSWSVGWLLAAGAKI